MKKAGRLVMAVLAGVVVWGLLWNVGTVALQQAFPESMAAGEPVSHPGILGALIAYSVVLSGVAGYVTAVLARERARTAVWSLAAVNLAIGVAVEIAYWELMPLWYHLLFLALVVPATVLGGRLRERRGPAGGRAAAGA